jgi:D-galactose 1-dehydrogenase
MAKIATALVGVGKIAREQHIPVIAANPDYRLVACAGRGQTVENTANFNTIEDMLAGCPEIEAVAVCTPTASHYQAARLALMAGKHVLLEKPPCATTAELDRLAALARRTKRSFFQTWHLRHAPRVADAQTWMKKRIVQGGRIVWRENVRVSHPGQDWIWQPGGYGVFDPGINAISVLTRILPEPVFVEKAELFFPSNCDCPVAAETVFRTESGARIEATMDFDYRSKPTWDIDLDTNGGHLKLSEAASVLAIDGKVQDLPESPDGIYAEYAALYRRFAELIAAGESSADAGPFRLVADVFLVGKRSTVAPFSLD